MIIHNTLRDKLASGQPTLGTHFLSCDPDLPEIIGDSGLFDYGAYCAEYSTFDMQLLYHFARSGQCGNLPLMIKLDQKGQGFWAQAALGAGFKAILFTDIRDETDVETCYQTIRPDTPEYGGLVGVKLRRPALGGYDATGYLDDLKSILFLIMIEKNAAVDNLDAILSKAKARDADMTQWGHRTSVFPAANRRWRMTQRFRSSKSSSYENLSSTACRLALKLAVWKRRSDISI